MNNIFSKYFVIFLVFGFCFTAYTNLRAEALLERKESIALGPYNEVEFYPDVEDQYRFYYLPLPPHLSLRDYGELKNVPNFQFLKYSFDTRNEGLTQGGIIQAGISVSLPIELHEEAKKKLAAAYGVEQSEKIKIGMIDIPEASIVVYTAEGNIVEGKGKGFVPKYLGSGPSIRNAGDVAPLVIEVTPEGSAVYEKLLEGTTGLGINYFYSYQGTTPYVNVQINGTWASVYDHASRDSQFKAKVSSWFFWVPGANYESNRQSLKDDISHNTDVKITWNLKPQPGPEGDKLVALIEDKILTKIMEAVFSKEPLKADEKAVKEASAKDAGGWFFGGFNYAINTKDVTKRQAGKINFHYLGRERIVLKNKPTGNFVSVKPENDKMKEVMFVDVEKDNFFNSVKITTDAGGVNPEKEDIRGLKYTVFCGDAVREQNYIPNDEGTRLVPAGVSAKDDALFSDIYCVNPRGKYAITYQADISYINSSFSSGRIPLESNGYQMISYSNRAKWGITSISIDASEFTFKKDARDGGEDGKDYPKYIQCKLSHDSESLPFKINVKNKNSIVSFRFKRDDKPIAVEMEARGYDVTPLIRNYNYVPKDVSRDLIVLDNENFK